MNDFSGCVELIQSVTIEFVWFESWCSPRFANKSPPSRSFHRPSYGDYKIGWNLYKKNWSIVIYSVVVGFWYICWADKNMRRPTRERWNDKRALWYYPETRTVLLRPLTLNHSPCFMKNVRKKKIIIQTQHILGVIRPIFHIGRFCCSPFKWWETEEVNMSKLVPFTFLLLVIRLDWNRISQEPSQGQKCFTLQDCMFNM